MKVIKSRLSSVNEITGKQKHETGKEYRKSRYCIEQFVERGLLAYNALTREVIFLTMEEGGLFKDKTVLRKNDRMMQYLIEHWFYVPAGSDEHATGLAVRQAFRSWYRGTGGRMVNTYTIFTTTACNARCPYCYEYGVEKYPMTEKTAVDTADYIARTSSGSVTLRWFGGEPLCNQMAIDTITSRLAEMGISYRSTITSNGLLYSSVADSKITDEWKIQNTQITLDGTRDTYISVKRYIRVDTDPYEAVLANIGRLLELGVRVVIRLNCSGKNLNEMLSLIDELLERFHGHRRLRVYPYPMFEGVGEVPYSPTDDDREQMYDNCIKVFDKTVEYGIAPCSGAREIKGHHCMADSGESRVIYPDGRTALCQHYNDTEVCGSIYGESDAKMVESWTKSADELRECASCAQYPICFRLEKCPNETGCSNGERRFNRRKIEAEILAEYEKFMKGHEQCIN